MIGRRWLKSFIRPEDDSAVGEYDDSPVSMVTAGADDERGFRGDDQPQNMERAVDEDVDDREAPIEASKPQRTPSSHRPRPVTDEEDLSEGDDGGHREQLTEGEDDPLAPAYCLDDGELIDRAEEEEKPKSLPWSSRIQNAKDFFVSELLYRYDLLENDEKDVVKGVYRIEVRGNQGGIWTLYLDNDVNVVNRREEADVVLSCQQREFLQLVNGELNPQVAILAQKLRVTGDMRRAVMFQSILVPIGV